MKTKNQVLWIVLGIAVTFGVWSQRDLWSTKKKSPMTIGQMRAAILKLQKKVKLLSKPGHVEARQARRVPPGTVVAFAGPKSNKPEGWLLCDGRPLAGTKKGPFKKLFDAIGYTYGKNDKNSDIFYVPDYRGRFLRGVAYGDAEGRDPDRQERKPQRPGAAGKSNVGSVQQDQFKNHKHYPARVPLYDFKGGTATNKLIKTVREKARLFGVERLHEGGRETRPKNVYVHYIIKY